MRHSASKIVQSGRDSENKTLGKSNRCIVWNPSPPHFLFTFLKNLWKKLTRRAENRAARNAVHPLGIHTRSSIVWRFLSKRPRICFWLQWGSHVHDTERPRCHKKYFQSCVCACVCVRACVCVPVVESGRGPRGRFRPSSTREQQRSASGSTSTPPNPPLFARVLQARGYCVSTHPHHATGGRWRGRRLGRVRRLCKQQPITGQHQHGAPRFAETKFTSGFQEEQTIVSFSLRILSNRKFNSVSFNTTSRSQSVRNTATVTTATVTTDDNDWEAATSLSSVHTKHNITTVSCPKLDTPNRTHCAGLNATTKVNQRAQQHTETLVSKFSCEISQKRP